MRSRRMARQRGRFGLRGWTELAGQQVILVDDILGQGFTWPLCASMLSTTLKRRRWRRVCFWKGFAQAVAGGGAAAGVVQGGLCRR